ncbi:MAG: glycine C-acetyltransferase [Gemmataceae bacterium]
MSDTHLVQVLRPQLDDLRAKGLYKSERRLQSAQGAEIEVNGRPVLNFCANNYLGLANHPEIVAAAREAMEKYGYGMASVRFICGTQDLHKQLEAEVSRFLRKDDTILYSSCWDANGGLFETVLGDEDAVLSDELNHASIIDGVRLCKARRFRYRHGDMAELARCLQEASGCRLRVVVTDGVFSMDGALAKLPEICELADKHDAVVVVDDSHATGILGENGRGTAEALGCQDRVDIFTSTLGKTLGGAAGGFTCGRAEVIDYLRQRSRPYLFSNALPPPIVAAARKALELVGRSGEARPAPRQRQADARRPGVGRLHAQAGPAPDPPGDARRRIAGGADGRPAAGPGRLRDRLQLPRRAAGAGPHPLADVGGAHARAGGPGDRGVHGRRQGAGGDRLTGPGGLSDLSVTTAGGGGTCGGRRGRKGSNGPPPALPTAPRKTERFSTGKIGRRRERGG